MSESANPDAFDVFIIGGGVNGCGIARDLAGRGLSVGLAEMGDLGGATSSASTKMFHGGLRYLEYFEFRLVREALAEREVLLRAMPHISWPMRFVLPLDPDMRFPEGTPTARLLGVFMPWLKGRRPGWLIRLGLFLYDNLGRRQSLRGTSTVDLTHGPEGAALKPGLKKAFEYSDCWVQDARLVVLNARDAASRGAQILVRTKVVGARRHADHWVLQVEGPDGPRQIRTRAVVNAGGPWVADVLGSVLGAPSPERLRLVRGSHIVTRRLYDHEKCYFMQGPDGRIIFAIPYEDDFTLIGTTEADHASLTDKPTCSLEEAAYLRAFASRYFRIPVEEDDVVWTYSGVRPLIEDGSGSATAATREYELKMDEAGAPLLSVFGGKITTYRKLAEAAAKQLGPVFAGLQGDWTVGVPLPGGDFEVGGTPRLCADLTRAFPYLSEPLARRLVRTYGTEATDILTPSQSLDDLGRDFGCGVTKRELDWAIEKEWVRNGEDYLWRRTKMGLRLNEDEAAAVDAYIRENC